MIRRVQKLREFGSNHSLFCDDDDKKREKNEREKRRTNASEPRQSHVRRLLLLLLLVVVSGQRLSNTRDRGCSFFVMMIDSQGGAFSKRPNILYSKRPKGRFLYGSRRSHTLDLFFKNSLSFSLSLSLSLERDKKKKKLSKMSVCWSSDLWRDPTSFLVLYFC